MFRELLSSIIAVYKFVFSARRTDVLFYYPAHFNRDNDGSNPYFKPLIQLCENNGINYLMLEEPCRGYPSNPKAINATLFVVITALFHKIFTHTFKRSVFQTECMVGRFIDIITFHRLRVPRVITISNSMLDVWASINSDGHVFDLQHGIIYRGHIGYFIDNNHVRLSFTQPRRHVLLWGNLYNNMFDKAGDKFIVAGYPLYKKIDATATDKDRVIMVSLQFTADISPEMSAHLMGMLEEFSDEAVRQGYKLMLKHHPRFAGEVDLVPLMQKYSDYISLTTEPLDELAKKSMLHVTWGSTTTFEYAAYGVPTLLLYDDVFDWATTNFYGQYSYPLYQGMTSEQVLSRISDADIYAQDCKTVKQWYESAYSPLNKELLLKILKGDYFA